MQYNAQSCFTLHRQLEALRSIVREHEAATMKLRADLSTAFSRSRMAARTSSEAFPRTDVRPIGNPGPRPRNSATLPCGR